MNAHMAIITLLAFLSVVVMAAAMFWAMAGDDTSGEWGVDR